MKYEVCPLSSLFPSNLNGNIDASCYEGLIKKESEGFQVVLIASKSNYDKEDTLLLNLELRAHKINWVCYHEEDGTLNGYMSQDIVVPFPC